MMQKIDWKHVLNAVVVAVLTTVLHQTGAVPCTRPPVPTHAPHVDPTPAPSAEPEKPKRHYGWTRPAAGDIPERVFAAPAGMNADQLPPAVQLMHPPAAAEVPPGLPFDQGQLGSCGPHSAAAAIMYADTRAGRHGLPPPSRLFTYYATRALMGTVGRDSGVSNATMVRALANYGYCDESLWPYRIDQFRQRPPAAAFAQALGRKVHDYASVPQDLHQVRACLASGKPVVAGFTAYPSLESAATAATGDVPDPRWGERPIGGHDVLITGYDDDRKRFTLLNSWGQWGKGGFGTISYGYLLSPNLAADFWYVGSGR